MEKTKIYNLTVLISSLIGSLFAGYLTFSKFYSGSCSFNESCSYFLGYPTCMYGLVMFLILLVNSYFLVCVPKFNPSKLIKISLVVSFLGILFSGYFSLQETIFAPCFGSCNYSLFLPTCLYGMFVYVIVFVFSVLNLSKTKKSI